MGQGIAIALGGAGREVRLLARGPRRLVPPLTLHPGSWYDALRGTEIVLVATPDDAIRTAAAALLAQGGVQPAQAVLHLSGLLDRSALAPLEATGAALGSFHPIQTIADPRTAPARLSNAWAALEGDPRALTAGERLAAILGMQTVRIDGALKPLHHAAAVLVANYTVTLAALAERLARAAGVPAELAGRIYHPLLEGAVQNLADISPAAALTGPVARGDVETVRRHLALLPADVGRTYRVLGLEALALARERGLDPTAADALERLLAGSP